MYREYFVFKYVRSQDGAGATCYIYVSQNFRESVVDVLEKYLTKCRIKV